MGSQPRQTTLARPVSTEGIGLHTGAVSALTLLPAAPNAGIVFVCPSGEEVPALADHVTSTARATTLGRGGARAASVEHLLSALYGLGIDNVRVELHGEEVPACDGSAREWVALIRQAGVQRLGAPRRRVTLRGAVWAGEKDSWAVALPASRFTLAVGIDFGDPVVGRQDLWLSVTPGRYARELAPARTFAFQHEVEALLAAGLAKGGNEENALVVGPAGYSRPLRFPDEAVRHKAADAVGDLALCGFRLAAQVVLVRPSHRVCVMLARELQGIGARG